MRTDRVESYCLHADLPSPDQSVSRGINVHSGVDELNDSRPSCFFSDSALRPAATRRRRQRTHPRPTLSLHRGTSRFQRLLLRTAGWWAASRPRGGAEAGSAGRCSGGESRRQAPSVKWVAFCGSVEAPGSLPGQRRFRLMNRRAVAAPRVGRLCSSTSALARWSGAAAAGKEGGGLIHQRLETASGLLQPRWIYGWSRTKPRLQPAAAGTDSCRSSAACCAGAVGGSLPVGRKGTSKLLLLNRKKSTMRQKAYFVVKKSTDGTCNTDWHMP